MTKPNFVEIVVVLDRSGSMESVRKDTIGGFNTFITDQKANQVGEVKVTLTQFDDVYEVVYSGYPLQNVPMLSEATYVPRGMTALLDAVGRTIVNVGDRLSKTPEHERPSLVIFVVLTDGQENASKEMRLDKVKEMIKHQTDKYGWQFVFLGADQNAFQAAQMGFAASNTYNYCSTDTSNTFMNLSKGVSGARGAVASMDFMVNCSDAAGSIGDMMRSLDAQNKTKLAQDKIVNNNSSGTT